jgi:RNA polymerase sigma-70 factor, ECF subfamily
MQDNKLIKALVLNAQLGNNSAFEQLYQMTVEQIYALNLRLTGSPSIAQTMAVKTYLNAWQKISQKDEFSSILSWLKKITVETVLNEKAEGQKTSEKKSEDKFFTDNPLEKYIQELDSKNKIVYILHDIENFSFEEISKLSGISNDEIKTLLAQTREKLINLTEE